MFSLDESTVQAEGDLQYRAAAQWARMISILLCLPSVVFFSNRLANHNYGEYWNFGTTQKVMGILQHPEAITGLLYLVANDEYSKYGHPLGSVHQNK